MNRICRSAACIVTLTLTLTGILRAQEGQVSVPLELTSQGVILVRGSVDTITTTFSLDTGVGSYFISQKAFERISSRPLGTHVSFDIDGRRQKRQLFEIPSLSIGGILEINPAVGIWNMLDSSGVDGILSAMIFDHRTITLDFQEKRMILEDSASLGDRLQNGMLVPVKTRDDGERAWTYSLM